MYKICKKHWNNENSELTFRDKNDQCAEDNLPKAKKIIDRFPGEAEWFLASPKNLMKLGIKDKVSNVVSRNVYSWGDILHHKNKNVIIMLLIREDRKKKQASNNGKMYKKFRRVQKHWELFQRSENWDCLFSRVESGI